MTGSKSRRSQLATKKEKKKNARYFAGLAKDDLERAELEGREGWSRLCCWRRFEWPPANAVMLLPCQPAARKRPLATRSLSGSRTCLVFIIVIVLLGREGSRAATQIRYASRIVETKSGQIRGILQVRVIYRFYSLRADQLRAAQTNIDFVGWWTGREREREWREQNDAVIKNFLSYLKNMRENVERVVVWCINISSYLSDVWKF